MKNNFMLAENLYQKYSIESKLRQILVHVWLFFTSKGGFEERLGVFDSLKHVLCLRFNM